MEEKQIDDLEKEEDFLEEKKEPIETQEGQNPSTKPEESEEKINDVNEILNNNNEEAKSNTDCPKIEKTNENKKEDIWNGDPEENSPKPGRAWKFISGILLVLLIAAIYTNGFHLTGATAATIPITQIDAEEKVLDYVNNNLLRPPFTAEVKSSEELDGLFKVTLDVAGQEVNSYLTKDGKFFFPQGFDLTAPPLDLETPESEETELVEVSVDDDPVKGSQNAPVTIIEFSEYQCPFCKKYIDGAYPKIISEYINTGKVKYVFRDFPLGFHSNAKPAAMAAECAHEQDKFWEYHDLLFENQDSLSIENYKKWAADLGLDSEQFDDCLDTEKYKEEVEADLVDGQKYGVSGTPAFFINGKLISGAQPYTAFKQAIEEALEESTGKSQEQELEEQIEEIAEDLEEETEEPEETEEEQEEAEEIETSESDTTTTETKEIQITAKKWRFDPKTIEVNQGDKVKLVITNQNFDLKFILLEFDLEAEILAGETQTLEFTPTKKGTFEFNCGTYCTEKYGEVQGTALTGEVIVS